MGKQFVLIWAVIIGSVLISGCGGQTEMVHTSREEIKPLTPPPEAEGFHFMIMGDRTGGDITEGTQVWRQAIEQANRMQPDFVCTVGDLVWGYDDRQSWLQEANDLNDDLKALQMPYYPVAGNHEIYWLRNTQERPKDHHESAYETHFGPLWYAFEYQNCWFVYLFSDESDSEGRKGFAPDLQVMSEQQFTWLQGILQKADKADHVFLFMHHPRWTGKNYDDVWDEVHDVLVDAGNVSAVFTGHYHRADYAEKDGIDYYMLGTTGGGSPFQEHHFYWVSVQADDYRISEIPVDQPLDARLIKTQRHTLIEREDWSIQSPENRTLEWEISTKGYSFDKGVIDCHIDDPWDESGDHAVQVRFLDENRNVIEEEMLDGKYRWSCVYEAEPEKTYYFQIVDEDVSFDNESPGNQGKLAGYLVTREIREN
ncbi:MAG: metallophosphoesterase family protein [Planctomycetota bacterium]|jgi:UDP-2,3-diacylglucosamine pyrophosphatase LpxH